MFEPESLSELADSIRQYGILQPATVRTRGKDYELVAGERRFRAAKMAGLKELPCLIAQVGEEDSALLALMENLQRRGPELHGGGSGLAQLIQRWGLIGEEAARKLGNPSPPWPISCVFCACRRRWWSCWSQGDHPSATPGRCA